MGFRNIFKKTVTKISGDKSYTINRSRVGLTATDCYQGGSLFLNHTKFIPKHRVAALGLGFSYFILDTFSRIMDTFH